MELRFAKNGNVMIDDVRLIWKNFEGRKEVYNEKDKRNFTFVIPNLELANELINDVNQYGKGWNVRIKDPEEPGGDPFITMKVNVSFTGRGPNVYLISGNNRVKLDEESIGMLDNIRLASASFDIRPYDDVGRFGPFRSAYLVAMEVTQELDRFEAQYAEEEYPCE